jgi:hypothetical protein
MQEKKSFPVFCHFLVYILSCLGTNGFSFDFWVSLKLVFFSLFATLKGWKTKKIQLTPWMMNFDHPLLVHFNSYFILFYFILLLFFAHESYACLLSYHQNFTKHKTWHLDLNLHKLAIAKCHFWDVPQDVRLYMYVYLQIHQET